MTLHEIKGIEIFRAGKWRGDTYATADLDAMVDAFDKVGFKPPVKLGHKENSGDPAHGWVTSIRRVGDRLVANLADLPRAVYEAIKNRQYDTVSAEIFWNLDRAGRKFSRVLKAVALLGAEIPEVAGLAPLRSVVNAAIGGDCRKYVIPMEVTMTTIDPGREVDRRARALIAEGAAATYSDALRSVLADDRELAHKYVFGGEPPAKQVEARTMTITEAGEKIHAMTLAQMARSACRDYSAAMRIVLADPANADLRAAYNGV